VRLTSIDHALLSTDGSLLLCMACVLKSSSQAVPTTAEYMEGGDLFNALHKHNSSGLTWYRRCGAP